MHRKDFEQLHSILEDFFGRPLIGVRVDFDEGTVELAYETEAEIDDGHDEHGTDAAGQFTGTAEEVRATQARDRN